MTGRVFTSSDTPQRANELTSKEYVDSQIESTPKTLNLLDSRHQALSNNHGGTRLALQHLIKSVHGPDTTLADGANSLTLVASELEQYKATKDGIHIGMASLATETRVADYVKSADRATAVVDSANSSDRLRVGARINMVLFDGTEYITLDTVTVQGLTDTLENAQFATKADLADYAKTADVPSQTTTTNGTTVPVFVYLPGAAVTPTT